MVLYGDFAGVDFLAGFEMQLEKYQCLFSFF